MTEVAAIEQVTHSLIRAEPCCGCELSSGLLASRPTLQHFPFKAVWQAAGFKDSGVRRLTEPIDDFRASSEESSPHAYERRISGVPLGGSSGREWHFQFDETEIFWE